MPTTELAVDRHAWEERSERPATIPHHFAEQVRAHSQRRALICDRTGRSWTYGELDSLVRSLAGRILDRTEAIEGEPHAPVALLVSHDAAIVVAILAVLHAGRAYQALDTERPDGYLKEMVAHSRASIVITDAAHRERGDSLGIDVLGVDLQNLEKHAYPSRSHVNDIIAGLNHESAASIVMTSGSTGAPKRNTQTHGNLVGYVKFYRKVAQLGPEDCFSLVTRCSFFASTSAIFGSLLSGASLVPVDIRSVGLAGAWRSLARHRVSVYHSVPTVFRRLVNANASSERTDSMLPAMRVVRLGGEPVRNSDWKLTSRLNPHCQLMVVLSASETGPLAYDLYGPDSPPSRDASLGNAVTRDGDLLLPLRRRVPGVDLSIVCDEAWTESPGLSRWSAEVREGASPDDGAIGRLLVTSAALSVETAVSDDVVEQRPDEHGRTQWLSGDVARIDAHGAIHLLGRSDNRVKIAGAFVSLAEVEAALCDLPGIGVREAAVCALPPTDGAGDMRLAAWYVPAHPKAPPSKQQVRGALASVLAPHMVPAILIQQDALPTTATGKIDRNRLSLPEEVTVGVPDLAQRSRESCESERTLTDVDVNDTLQQGVAELWASALGRAARTVHADDNFFDLGGSSVAALDLLLGIERRFGVVLPIAALVEAPTPSQMADIVASRAVSASPTDLVTLRRGSTDRAASDPLLCVHPRDGWVFAFRDLAERLAGTYPVYALQSPGLGGRLAPLMSIESLAAHYIALVEKAVPRGPCRLCGYCIGGTVAAEMTRQLRQKGRDVSALILIDARMPEPRRGWTGVRERWLSWLRGPLLGVQVMARRTAAHRQRFVLSAAFRHKLKKIHSAALHRYRPQPLELAPLVMLTQDQTAANAARARALASALHHETKIISIPGEHNTCLMPPHIDSIAPLIDRWLSGDDQKR